MPECPIRIEGPLPQGQGSLWRITPLGYVSDHDCTCRIFLDGQPVTGTGQYGNFYVDGYGAGSHIIINPRPTKPGVLRFEVDCPNCNSRIDVPIVPPPQLSTAEKIAVKIAIVLIGPPVAIGFVVVFGVVMIFSLPAIIFIGFTKWWDAVKKAWQRFIDQTANLWDVLWN